MSLNLIPIKAFLGKYYSELNYSSVQEKYKNTKLDTFFEQRFYIQNNKVQMIIDPGLVGLQVGIQGNEIHISKDLYDHPNVVITNTIENINQTSNPKSLYNPETFSSLAYLICENQTIFQIIGEIDQPIYVKYRTDYECFYSSVTLFEVVSDISIEIVEEIESWSAINLMTNYVVRPRGNIKLTTFYQNSIPGISFTARNVIVQENASFDHMVLGKGSSNIIDEIKLHAYENSRSEFLGIVNSANRNFHSVLVVQPMSENYKVNVDYRNIMSENADVTFYPVILGQEPLGKATILVTDMKIEEIPEDTIENELKKFLDDMINRFVLERMQGVKRFYDNKSKFFHLHK
jgi:hypothetical protein